MGTVTTVAMAKGGVGRTTLAVNVADRLAARGGDVLLVDLTGQGGATAYLAEREAGVGIGATVEGEIAVTEAVRSVGSIDLLAADDDWTAVLEAVRGDPLRVRRSVTAPAAERYGHVIVDTPPTVGPASDGALVGSGQVVLPFEPTPGGVDGLERTIDHQLVPLRRERPLPIASIVPTGLHGTEAEAEVVSDLVDSGLSEYLPAFATPEADDAVPGLRHRPAFDQAWRAGEPIASYDPESGALDRLDALAAVVAGGADA